MIYKSYQKHMQQKHIGSGPTVNTQDSRPAVLNLLLQFPHFGHYQTIISPLPQPNIP